MARKNPPHVGPPDMPERNSAIHRLPQIEWVERNGPSLHPTALTADPEVLGLNLTRGCLHRCVFCCVRASPNYIGDSVIQLFKDTASRLSVELAARPRRPRAVFISPATDPCPPISEIQAETTRVVSTLAQHGIESWLMTRGLIRPVLRETLATHRIRVKLTIPITTCNRGLQRRLEPLTASPRLRLRQVAEMRELGVSVQVALDPLFPGVTDTRENLVELLGALSRIGIRQITASYLFLRPAIAENLRRALASFKIDDAVLAAYEGGPMLTSAGLSSARYLPRSRRQRGYASLMTLAADFGIRVNISGLTNPDFGAPRAVTVVPGVSRQLSLPLLADRGVPDQL
ncbi:MAG: radical SAM protein [Candidatus Acidiferrum sp.]